VSEREQRFRLTLGQGICVDVATRLAFTAGTVTLVKPVTFVVDAVEESPGDVPGAPPNLTFEVRALYGTQRLELTQLAQLPGGAS
jgi:hypothetical protein